MLDELKKKGIIAQVSLLFLISTMIIGLLTFLSERTIADSEVRFQVEQLAKATAREAESDLKSYPASSWLIEYWYYNHDQMDIDYDEDFIVKTETRKKCEKLAEKYPDLQLKYATEEEITAMTPEYQKLYAEIIYAWYINSIDSIKNTYGIDYLFGIVTEEPFEDQFFLFSAADPDSVRGTNYEEVYPIGVEVKVSESQKDAMVNATLQMSHLADAGDYMDYYSYIDEFDGHYLMLGLTYNLEDMRSESLYKLVSGMVTAMVFQITLSLVCLLLLYFFILKPLQMVQHNIRLYKESKDSGIVKDNLSKVKAKNELGQLSKDVTELADEIDNYLLEIEEITAEKERIGVELDLASRIQASMLPSSFPAFPDIESFDIYATMDPAKEVGGDFYDFFMIDDDHLCMVMADVSGKGVPAALFMMASKIIIQNNAKMGKSPGKILEDVNDSISANNKEEMFVTVWLGILELSTGRLTASNAGHECPCIRKADGNFELIRTKHGFVIGGMEGISYREHEMVLEPGSSVFLYTDGVPEATASDGTMFGNDRMLEALNREPGGDPETILKNMRNALDGFVGSAEQFDDVTMMCVTYKGH